MTEARVGERAHERASQGWAGAAREGQVPVRAGGGAPDGAAPAGVSPAAPAASRWSRKVLRVLRDLAISAVLVAMVPIGLTSFVSRQGTPRWMESGFVNTAARMRGAERLRGYAIARDPSVDAEAAGRALSALMPARHVSPGWVERPVSERIARSWATAKIPAAFTTQRGYSSWNGPASASVLLTVAKGVAPADLAYLRMISTAPVWPAFDLVARAPRVDLLGGRYELPLGSDARSYSMPLWSFAGTKELAYASVSRAAYYLAIGQRGEAEAVLQRTVGFGFAFIDNSTNLLDALIGRMIVDIGRAGLQDLYAVTGDPRLADLIAASVPPAAPKLARERLTISELRQVQLNNATSAVLPRAVRLENLNALAQTVCTNPRELVFGPGRDVRDAYAKAGRELARFPSERAMLDLMLRTPSLPVADRPQGSLSARVLVGASTIASIIFDNPRMAYCARVITGGSP